MIRASTADLLAAWEEGLGEPAVDRAPSFLRSLGLIQARDPAAMTVGECDLMLFELRGWLFGPDLEMVATCPACGEVLDLVIPAPALLPDPPANVVSQVTVEDDGLRIRCRLPTNADLTAISALGTAATAVDLLDRCVVEIAGQDAPSAAGDLPPALAERVISTLAASDPGAEITADIACPCGAQWREVVDIRSILCTELTSWARARLAEVHELASAYGWAERDILAMSAYRRRFYLEACAG